MRFPIILLLILVSTIAHAQSPRVKGFLDKVISIMKEHAMNSKNVDWPAVTEKAYKLADKAKTPEDAGESITFLFQSLGDFHGVLRYKKKYFHWQHPLSLPDIYKTELARKDNKFFTRQLDGIGYLRIPTTSMADVNVEERSHALQDSLCKILSEKPRGLIFDLRLNGGGNVFSMATGISTILSPGLLMGTDEVKTDGYYRDSRNIYPFNQTCFPVNSSIPVAVIIGPYTASSAEALAIILKWRPNTVLIGEPTAGLITGVAGYKVDRKSHVNLAVGNMTDIKGNIYTDNVKPGIVVNEGDNFLDLMKDEKVLKAINWITSLK